LGSDTEEASVARAALTAVQDFTAVYHGRADEVGRARHEVTAYLSGCPAADDAGLILSELATNAVLHSRSRGGYFVVRSEMFPGYAWLEVEDAGGGWDQHGDGDGGRGLVIVEALAAEWGVDGDARGRVVWARIEW
jgi:two-component sensor histidine kinase